MRLLTASWQPWELFGEVEVSLLWGLVGIGAGIITFLWPAITALALVIVIAGWAIATGAVEIAAAIALRKEVKGEWILALTGLVSNLFGALLFIFRGRGPSRSFG